MLAAVRDVSESAARMGGVVPLRVVSRGEPRVAVADGENEPLIQALRAVLERGLVQQVTCEDALEKVDGPSHDGLHEEDNGEVIPRFLSSGRDAEAVAPPPGSLRVKLAMSGAIDQAGVNTALAWRTWRHRSAAAVAYCRAHRLVLMGACGIVAGGLLFGIESRVARFDPGIGAAAATVPVAAERALLGAPVQRVEFGAVSSAGDAEISTFDRDALDALVATVSGTALEKTQLEAAVREVDALNVLTPAAAQHIAAISPSPDVAAQAPPQQQEQPEMRKEPLSPAKNVVRKGPAWSGQRKVGKVAPAPKKVAVQQQKRHVPAATLEDAFSKMLENYQ